MKHTKIIFAFQFSIFCFYNAVAQKDTLITRQGDVLAGFVESLSKGELNFKTNYVTDIITLKWSEVVAVKTVKPVKIFDKKGNLIIGKLLMVNEANGITVSIITKDSVVHFLKSEIVQIYKFNNRKLTDKLSLKIDVGYTRAKADKTQQLSLALGASYETKRWQLTFDYLSFASEVDSIVNGRGNIGLGVKYILPRNWFITGRTGFFYSSEQQIDSRVTHYLGLGKYLMRKEKDELSFFAGVTYNKEKFTKSVTYFKSAEIFSGFNLDFYLKKKVDIISTFIIYPNLTEAGRIRSYFNNDIRFDFAKHFAFGLNYTLNTNNKPPVISNKSDYILSLKFGWKL